MKGRERFTVDAQFHHSIATVAQAATMTKVKGQGHRGPRGHRAPQSVYIKLP